MDPAPTSIEQDTLQIAVRGAVLEADLCRPALARGLVLFAHCSGSNRFSPRNREVTRQFNEARLATVLVDLLTPAEEAVDERTHELRFDIALLADRLVDLTDRLGEHDQAAAASLPLGYFGARTAAGAALAAAALRPDAARAMVSLGGRPDLVSMGTLALVRAPTLLIVGGSDGAVIDLNQRALALLPGQKRLLIVPGATHLFEEPGVPSAPFRRSHATGFCTISAAQPGARHKQLFWPPVRAANKTYYLAQNVGEHTPHHGEAMKECFACAVHKRRRRRRS